MYLSPPVIWNTICFTLAFGIYTNRYVDIFLKTFFETQNEKNTSNPTFKTHIKTTLKNTKFQLVQSFQVESIVEGQPEGAINFASVSWEMNEGSLDPHFTPSVLEGIPGRSGVIKLYTHLLPFMFRPFIKGLVITLLLKYTTSLKLTVQTS